MKPLITLFIVAFSASLFSQQVNGVIVFQNSGSKAAVGVKIRATGCGTVYSDSDGIFSLPCRKKPGQKVNLRVGRQDGEGNDIEWVNSNQFEVFNMPASPDDEIDIVVCLEGQLDEAITSYYGILIKDNDEKYEKKLREIDRKIDENKKNNETIASLVRQKEQLLNEQEKAEEKIEELAENLASINLDQASELVKEAVTLLQNQDVEAALAKLDDTKLEESLQVAQDSKEKANKAIKDIIEAYQLKISWLKPQFAYDTIAFYYNRIIDIHESNNFNKNELASILRSASSNKYDGGKYQDAINLQLKALNSVDPTIDRDTILTSSIYTGLGLSYYQLGEYQKALDSHQEAINLLKDSPDSTSMVLSETYNNIALVYQELENYEKALDYLNQALNIELNQDSINQPSVAMTYHNISLVQLGLGQLDEAIENKLTAINQAEEVLDPNHPDLAIYYSGMSSYYFRKRNYEKALEFQLKTVAIREKILSATHPKLALSYNELGTINRRLGKSEEGLEYFLKCISIAEERFGSIHPDLAKYYQNTGFCFRDIKQYDKALEYQQKALNIREQLPNVSERSMAISYANMGTTNYLLKDYLKAVEFQSKAVEIGRRIYKPGYRSLNRMTLEYSLSLSAANKTEEAKTILLELENILPEDERVPRNMIIMHACSGNEKEALKSLQKAIDLGFKDLDWLQTNPCVDTLVANEKYKEITAALVTAEK